jgi:hypothetical protein
LGSELGFEGGEAGFELGDLLPLAVDRLLQQRNVRLLHRRRINPRRLRRLSEAERRK